MRLLHLRLVLCLFVFSACNLCFSQDSHFPAKVFGTDRSGIRKQEYFDYVLKVLDEPSLSTQKQDSGTEIYRFILLHSFDSPLVIRMEIRSDGSALVTTKIGDGRAGFPYTMKHVLRTQVRTATLEEVKRFRSQVEKVSFWTLDSRDPGFAAATDGDSWVIEGMQNAKYHVVERVFPNTKPDKARAVETLGLIFAFELGHMTIEKN